MLETKSKYAKEHSTLCFMYKFNFFVKTKPETIPRVRFSEVSSQGGGAGSRVWTRGSVIAREKKSGRVRLSTNALKINMEDVPSIVVIENLSWSSSVSRQLLLFLLALVNLDLPWRESQTSWMESKRLVEESLTAVSTCSHLMENLLKVFYCQALEL